METFSTAFFIILGAIAAIGLVWLLASAAKIALALWIHHRNQKRYAESQNLRAVALQRRRAQWNAQAVEALKDPVVHEVWKELSTTPYRHAQTKAAKKQNYQRQKLQAKLRKHVEDPNVRSILYEKSNIELGTLFEKNI